MGTASSKNLPNRSVDGSGKDTKKGRREFIATVIVVLLMTSVLLVLVLNQRDQFTSNGPEDEEPIDPWAVDSIEGNVTWEWENLMMDRPLVIRSGSTLTIDDCTFVVPMEDLILWNSSFFIVEAGGSLVLESSFISVRTPDQLDSTVYYLVNDSEGLSSEQGIPYLSRVVNLVETVEPTLEFNFRWHGDINGLMVMGQSSRTSALQSLAWLAIETEHNYGWSEYRVDLGPLGNGIARVVIAPVDLTRGAILLSEVRVTDGGNTPVGDAFPTGNPLMDGWDQGGPGRFRSVNEGMGAHKRWPSLIDVEGDLQLIDTNIQIGIDVARYHMADIDNDELQIPSIGNWNNIDLASRGSHIEVRSGSLELRHSDLFGVPIIASGSEVVIRDTDFFGRGNDVTLFECSGSITESGFASPTQPHIDPRTDVYPFLEEYKFDDQYIWSLSIEGNRDGDPFVIEGCRFGGSDVALVVDDVNVDVNRCTFDEVSKIAIWNRDSESLGDWEDIVIDNEFGEYDGMHLLATHTTSVHFQGEDMPNEDEPYDWANGFINDQAAYGIPDVHMLTLGWDRAILEVPTELVGMKHTVLDLSEIPIYLRTSWGDYAVLIINSSYDGGNIWFTGEHDWWQDVPLPGEGIDVFHFRTMLNELTGNVAINISIDRDELEGLGYNHSLTMDIFLNGESFKSFELWNDSLQGYYYSHLEADLLLEGGWNKLSLSLSGSTTSSGDASILETSNISILMVTSSTPEEVVQQSIQDRGNLIVFGPDVTMDLEGVVPFGHGSSSFWIRQLSLLLHDGARLSLEGVKDERSDFLDVFQKGPGHLQLSNFSCGILLLYTSDSKVDLTDCSVDHHIGNWGDETGLELTISACRLEFPPWGNQLSGKDMDVTIQNSVFYAKEPSDYGLSLSGNSTILVEDCTFHDITLGLTPSLYSDYNVQATVRRCRFYGSCSFISMADPYYLNYEDNNPDLWNGTFVVEIVDNTFTAPNTGIYGRPNQIMMVDESNQFLEGAKVLVWKRAEVLSDGGSDGHGYYNDYYYRYFMDDARDLDKRFLGFYYRDYEDPVALMDVTGNTAMAEGPWSVWVMVRHTHNYRGDGPVVWFEKVSALPTVQYIHAPTWGTPDADIARIIGQGEPEDNQWEW